MPHCLNAVLQMRRIVTDVACSVVCESVCLCVCVLGIRACCATTAEPIEMPFGALTHVVQEIMY